MPARASNIARGPRREFDRGRARRYSARRVQAGWPVIETAGGKLVCLVKRKQPDGMERWMDGERALAPRAGTELAGKP